MMMMMNFWLAPIAPNAAVENCTVYNHHHYHYHHRYVLDDAGNRSFSTRTIYFISFPKANILSLSMVAWCVGFFSGRILFFSVLPFSLSLFPIGNFTIQSGDKSNDNNNSNHKSNENEL